jgi:hypothetical protein
LDWDNLIKDNNEELKKLFIDDIMSVYLNDEIYYYYKYFRNKYENKKIICEIMNDISKYKKEEIFPDFISNFFNDMNTSINRHKTDTFDNYDNINYFNEKLKEVLKEKLYNYFNI